MRAKIETGDGEREGGAFVIFQLIFYCLPAQVQVTDFSSEYLRSKSKLHMC